MLLKAARIRISFAPAIFGSPQMTWAKSSSNRSNAGPPQTNHVLPFLKLMNQQNDATSLETNVAASTTHRLEYDKRYRAHNDITVLLLFCKHGEVIKV